MKRYAVTVALCVILAVLFVWIGVSSFIHRNDLRIYEIVVPHLKCPPDETAIESQGHTDTSEVYVVEGCGKRVTLRCQSPDFVCFVEGH